MGRTATLLHAARRLGLLLAVGLGVALGLGTTATGQTGTPANNVAVIVHAEVPAVTLRRADLLDLYLGDVRFWRDGTEIVLFDQQPSSEVKSSFYDYLGRSITRMKSLWLRRRLAGEGDPPEALASDAEVLARVAETPGAIGFVRADRARGYPGVRVVRVVPLED